MTVPLLAAAAERALPTLTPTGFSRDLKIVTVVALDEDDVGDENAVCYYVLADEDYSVGTSCCSYGADSQTDNWKVDVDSVAGCGSKKT